MLLSSTDDTIYAINQFPILNRYAICTGFNLEPETASRIITLIGELGAVDEAAEIPKEYLKGPFFQIKPLWKDLEYGYEELLGEFLQNVEGGIKWSCYAGDILSAVNQFPILNRYAICKGFNLKSETVSRIMASFKELDAVEEVAEIPKEYLEGPFFQIKPLWKGLNYENILTNLFRNIGEGE